MALKQDCVHFAVCPKRGNKIEGVVLNRVCILNFSFCPKEGQGFKPSEADVEYPPLLPPPGLFSALFNFAFFKIVRYLFIGI